MTPEEKFNQTIWWVLQELKKEYLATSEDKYVSFNYQTPSEKIPSHDDQRRALGVLQKEGAIKIIKNEYPRPFESLGERIEMKPIRVLLDIPVKEQFEKVYKKYQKACDLNSYLNDYQQKVFKEEKELPKFSYVEHEEEIIKEQEAKQAIPSTTNRNLSLSEIADEKIVKFFKDERQLLNKLLQICNEKTRWVLLMYPAHLADNDPDKASFNRIETLKDLQDKYKVFRKFIPPLNSTHLPHVQIIKAWVNFQKLKNRAENLHDEIESWKGNVIGIEQQKRELLQRLNSKFTQYPSQQTYTYSEKLLGAYTPANSFKPLGLSLLSPDKHRPDIRYNFMQAMRGLEKDGHFEIVDVDIDFFAKPQPTEESEKLVRWSLGTREYQFYTAEHCKVTLRVKRNTRYNQLVEEIRRPKEPAQDMEKRHDKVVSEIKLNSKRPIVSLPPKRELRKKISNIIQTGKFGKKEKALLKYLAKDFEPKTIEEVSKSKEVATKACTKLKAGVQKKLKGTGFNIKTDKGGWGRQSTYQLEYLLTSENS